MTIDGVGSTWSNSGQLMVGDSFNFTGDATVLISNGGTLTCNNCHTQGSFGHPSTVTVDGVGSVWNTNFLTIGEGGSSSTVTITNGGQINVANNAGIDDAAIVDGSASKWNVAGILRR